MEKRKKSRKKKNKKERLKGFFSSIEFLEIIFVILLILVIVLSFFVYRKKQIEKKDVKANMIIPIKDFDAEYSFGIELKALAGKKYIFKVTNYRKDEVNAEDVYYKIAIDNGTKSTVSISSGEAKQIIKPETSVESDDFKLSKNKEMTDCYYVEIEEKKSIKESDRIMITITSEKESEDTEE